MSLWPRPLEPTVLAPATTGASAFISQYGGDPDRLFGNLGLPVEELENPALALRLGSYCRLFEDAATLTGHDNIGLWFGNQFRPRDLGLLGYAAVSSPDLTTALRNLVGLFHFHQQASVLVMRSDGDTMRLEYQITDGAILERRQDAELSLGMFLNVFRECHGTRWVPREVHFEHPVPEQPQEHERAFGAPVYFNQPTNALVFGHDVLDAPMPSADTRLLAVVRSCLAALQEDSAETQTVVDRTRAAVRNRLADGYPAIEDIARELGLGVATLQRRLAGENMTYKQLVEETRQDLAAVYLKKFHLPISEVAFLLGYSEISAFSRAFRRWTGVSPKLYRQRLEAKWSETITMGRSARN